VLPVESGARGVPCDSGSESGELKQWIRRKRSRRRESAGRPAVVQPAERGRGPIASAPCSICSGRAASFVAMQGNPARRGMAEANAPAYAGRVATTPASIACTQRSITSHEAGDGASHDVEDGVASNARRRPAALCSRA
jgi:hypothetical protein